MRFRQPVVVLVLGLGLGLVLGSAACGGTPRTATPAGPAATPLYDRLGGRDAIVSIVDDFLANVAADVRINAFFANADVPDLSAKLVDQFCEASGGPCKYTGLSMRDSHLSMGVTEADFAALVEDLVKALDTAKVPAAEQAELLAKIGAMKGDIVTK